MLNVGNERLSVKQDVAYWKNNNKFVRFVSSIASSRYFIPNLFPERN